MAMANVSPVPSILKSLGTMLIPGPDADATWSCLKTDDVWQICWGGIKTDLVSISIWMFYCTTAHWWEQLQYQNFPTTISHCQSHLLPLQKRRNKNLPESNMAMGNPQTKWAFKSEHHWITWGDLSSKPCLRTPEGDQCKSQPKRRRYHCKRAWQHSKFLEERKACVDQTPSDDEALVYDS